MTRQKIKEAQEINSLQGGCDCANIQDLIDELTALQNLGWSHVETDVSYSYGDDSFTISASRKRDETDEEMTARLEREQAYAYHQMAEYERNMAAFRKELIQRATWSADQQAEYERLKALYG